MGIVALTAVALNKLDLLVEFDIVRSQLINLKNSKGQTWLSLSPLLRGRNLPAYLITQLFCYRLSVPQLPLQLQIPLAKTISLTRDEGKNAALRFVRSACNRSHLREEASQENKQGLSYRPVSNASLTFCTLSEEGDIPERSWRKKDQHVLEDNSHLHSLNSVPSSERVLPPAASPCRSHPSKSC